MSTGDQTQYIRGKLAQRGVSQGVKFMKDGFDLWAESTAPARAGEMEKEPAEVTNMEGGRMTLRMAKRFQHRRGGEMCGGEMSGGALPQVVEDGIKFGRQLIDVYKKVSAWIDDFQGDLDDEIINNPASNPNLVDFAKQLKTYLATMMSYKSIVDEIIKVTGAGKGGRTGGDLAATIATATEYAKKIINVVMWFRKYASSIKQVLSLRSLNVEGGYGKQLLSAIEPFLNIVSIGAALPKVNYSMDGGRRCGCDSDSEDECGCRPMRRGRAKPMSVKELQDAVKKALAEPKEGKISSHVSSLVEKAKKIEARRKRTTGGAWYDDVASAFSPQSYSGQIAERMPEPMFEMARVPKEEMMMAAAGRRRPKRRGGAELYYPPPATGGVLKRKGGATISLEPVGGAMDGEYRSGLSADTARRVGGRKKRAPSARGAIVSKVMREKGLSLPQASKYVKDNGLY